MEITFALANKLANFKNAKQKFENGTLYKLDYPKGETATEETMITIDDNREITVGDLLNLFVEVQTEKVGEFTFMKKGERAITLHERLSTEAKAAGNEDGYELPKAFKVDQRVTVGTTLENVEKLDNAKNILKGYDLCKIDTTQDRIPQLWATEKADAKYDNKDDFKVRTKVVITAEA